MTKKLCGCIGLLLITFLVGCGGSDKESSNKPVKQPPVAKKPVWGGDRLVFGAKSLSTEDDDLFVGTFKVSDTESKTGTGLGPAAVGARLFSSNVDETPSSKSIASTPLITNDNFQFTPAWSPDGKQIAYLEGKTIKSKRSFYIVNADGTNPKPLFAPGSDGEKLDGYDISWTPDGKKLLFAAVPEDSKDDLDIYQVNVDGTGLTNLTSSSSYSEYGPQMSHDGKTILFYFYERGKKDSDLGKMDADGSNSLIIGRGNKGFYQAYPKWSWDDKYIIYYEKGTKKNDKVICLLPTEVKDRSKKNFICIPLGNGYTEGFAVSSKSNVIAVPYFSGVYFATYTTKRVDGVETLDDYRVEPAYIRAKGSYTPSW